MREYKVGDTVICINDTNWHIKAVRWLNYLPTLGNTYVIREIAFDVQTHKEFVYVEGFVNKKEPYSNIEAGYSAERFMKLFKVTEKETKNVSTPVIEEVE